MFGLVREILFREVMRMDRYCKSCDCFYVIADSSVECAADGHELELCPVCWDVLSLDIPGTNILEAELGME